MEKELLILGEIWQGLKNRYKQVILLTLLCAVLAAVLSIIFVKPTYESKASFMINRPSSYSSENQAVAYDNDIQMYQQLMRTYVEILKSDKVINQVIENLSLDLKPQDFENILTVQVANNSNIIGFSITDDTAVGSEKIAKEITDVFMSVAKDTMEEDNVVLFDEAHIAEEPSTFAAIKYGIIGAILGFILAVMVVTFQEFTRPVVRSSRDFTDTFGLPVYGSIPKNNGERV